MRRRSTLTVACLCLCSSAPGLAAERRPVREARSENGAYQLRITLGRPARLAGGACRGVLIHRDREQRKTRTVWESTLVNAVGPTRAFVRNDGRFVVTLDEYRRGGARHALVVYDKKGEAAREFDLRELLRRDDWPHVERRREALEWLEDAAFAFEDKRSQFVIKLEWKRTIRIDLEKLALVPDAEDKNGIAGDESGAIEVPAEFLALLGELPEHLRADAGAETGTDAGDEQGAGGGEPTDISPDGVTDAALAAALEKLRELRDKGSASQAEVEAVARALLEAIEDGKLEATVRRDGQETPIQLRVQDADLSEADRDEMRVLLEQALQQQIESAGLSPQTGVAVPLPRPDAPVDYLEWLNAFSQTDGPSAAGLLRAAADDAVPYDFDNELYEAAMNGGADALHDPAVSQWIEANRDAIAALHDATAYEFNGYQLESEDGSLIGALLPMLSGLRQTTKAAVMDGKRLESEGRVQEAAESYFDTIAAGSLTGRGPTIIENLVGHAMQKIATDALLDEYAADTAGELDYAALAEQADASFQPMRTPAEYMQFERAMMLDVVQRLYDYDPADGSYPVAPDGGEYFATLQGMAGSDGLDHLAARQVLTEISFDGMVADVNDQYDRLTEAAQQPYQDARAAFELSEEAVAELSERNPLLGALVPSLSRYNFLNTRGVATRRATRLVTHLRAYHQSFGAYPDSLELFGESEFIRDPFTGDPFVFYRDGDDFVLYSRGDNGMDDGGLHDPRGEQNDLRFWPRPERGE